MVQVFLGYRPVMAHVLFKAPRGEPQIVEQFCPEVEEWCKINLKGWAQPVYVEVKKPEEPNGRFFRWEFEFEFEEDIWLFKLGFIG
jgi:hypothetical protein